MTITLQALSLVEKPKEPVQVCFTLYLRDQRSKWLRDGCKVYMDSYMALNGPSFKNHLFDVGLTQNQETMSFQTFITIDLLYSIMCGDPHE